VKSFLKTKKGKYILITLATLVVVLGFGAHKAISYKSPEYLENERLIKQTIQTGWPLKILASLEENKDKLDEFRKQLPEYYSNEQQELTKQQRLVTIAAAEYEVEEGSMPQVYEKYYAGEKQVLGIRFSEFDVTDIRIKKDRATVTAKIEYFKDKFTLSQKYSSLISETYKWELVKSKDKWLIVKEELLQGDKNK